MIKNELNRIEHVIRDGQLQNDIPFIIIRIGVSADPDTVHNGTFRWI